MSSKRARDPSPMPAQPKATKRGRRDDERERDRLVWPNEPLPSRSDMQALLWASHMDANRLLEAFPYTANVVRERTMKETGVSLSDLRKMLLCLGFDRERVQKERRGTVLMAYVQEWAAQAE